MLPTASQLKQRLTRVHELMESPVFNRDSAEDDWKASFAEMIALVDDLLIQSQRMGKRIDFYEGVGVTGKVQDITSLVTWMRACLPDSTAHFSNKQTDHRLNRYFDEGTGYFANGSFFTGDHDDELAFYIDDQRIYLKRHLMRAVYEAESNLRNAPKSSL